MRGLLLTTDLIFASRALSIARENQLQLEVVASTSELAEQLEQRPAALVLLDLTAPDCRPQELLPALRSRHATPRIVAYGPHVMEGKLAAARDAQCDLVLTRGQFDRQMADLLVQYLGCRR